MGKTTRWVKLLRVVAFLSGLVLVAAYQPSPLWAAGVPNVPGLGSAAAVSAAAKATDYASWGNSWAAPYIGVAMADRVISGFPDGSFQPDGPLTRAQFAEMLWKVLGAPEVPAGAQAVTGRGLTGLGLPADVSITLNADPLGGDASAWLAYQNGFRTRMIGQWYGPAVDYLAWTGAVHTLIPPGQGYWSGKMDRLEAASWVGRILEEFNLPTNELVSYVTMNGTRQGLAGVPFPATWAAHGLPAAPEVTFFDLNASTPQYEDVQFAAVAGIITGIANSPGTPPNFDGGSQLTRAQGAAVIDRLIAVVYGSS